MKTIRLLALSLCVMLYSFSAAACLYPWCSCPIMSGQVEAIQPDGTFRVWVERTDYPNHLVFGVYFRGGTSGHDWSEPKYLTLSAVCMVEPSLLRIVPKDCGNREYLPGQWSTMIAPPGATKPTVSLTVDKAFDPSAGRVRRKATVTWNFGNYSNAWDVHVDILKWVGVNGQTHSGSVLWRPKPVTRTGTQEFFFDPPGGAQQMTLVAVAQSCIGRTTQELSVDCADCDETSSEDPVYFNDGNVRVTDGEPLPPVAGHGLLRTYNSDEQGIAPFGRGWTTLLDQRLIVNGDDGEDVISVVTATNEVVTFRGTPGAYRQTWPSRRDANPTLSYDSVAQSYAFRAAGSSEVAVFRASDGRLVELRDLGTGRSATITYLPGGLPATFTDSRTGTRWEITSDTTRRLVTSIAVSGHPELTWTYAYDGSRNLTSIQAPGSATWRTYAYAANRMIASYDGSGHLIESHDYDANGYGVSSTGPSDEIQNIEYNIPTANPDERITRVTEKNENVIDYVLAPSGGSWRTVRIDGGCGSCGSRDTSLARDSRGRIIRRQSAEGYVTENGYTADHLTSTTTALSPAGCEPETDANRCRLAPGDLATAALAPTAATVLTTYTYGDPLWPDRVTAVETASVFAAGGLRREESLLDPATGAPVTTSITGWTGSPARQETRVTTTALYNGSEGAAFNPGPWFPQAWRALPQPAKQRKSVNGPRPGNGDVTSYVYYPVDPSVPAEWRGRLAASRNPAGHVTRIESYDVFGNATRLVDANGVATEMTYDSLGRLVTTTLKGVTGCDTTADALCGSDITRTRSYDGTGPLANESHQGSVTSYSYDDRGRVVAISRGPSLADLRERVETTYDPVTSFKTEERILAFENGSWVERKRETYTYDASGRLSGVTHPDGASVHNTYGPGAQLVGVQDENHAEPNTLYDYDPAGRLEKVTQTLSTTPAGSIHTVYAYDRGGNLVSVTDPNGNRTTYRYDDFGMMVEQASPVSGTTRYEYDRAGNLLSTTAADGSVTTRIYDAAGRVQSATSTREYRSEAVTWTYDGGTFGKGRLTSMTDPTGATAYTYDRRGLLLSETKSIGGVSYTTSFGYDEDGNRTRIVYPSGRIVDYGFDHASRPYSAATGETPLILSASYLPFGPMRELVFGNGTTRVMTYDQRYRLMTNRLNGPLTSGEGEEISGTIASYEYTYDPAGNVTRIADLTNPAYDRDFGYDDLHRLITANSGSGLWGAGSYTYDAMGNMRSSAVGSNLRALTMSGTTPRIASVLTDGRSEGVSYDANGNEIVVGAKTFAYTPRNLLRTAGDRTFEYDGRGVRTTTHYAVTLAALSLDVATASPNQTVTGIVSLSAIAPAGGIAVRLQSSRSAVSMPSEVVVAAGQASAVFTIAVASNAAPQTLTITATHATSISVPLTITAAPGLAAFSASPSEIVGGAPVTVAVTLAEAAGEEGAVVAITSEREAIASGTVIVAAGETSGSTVLESFDVLSPVMVVLAASYGGATLEASVQVQPAAPAVDRLVIVPDGVLGGETTNGTILLVDPLPPAGRVFQLTSSNPGVAEVPASVQIGGDCDGGDGGSNACTNGAFAIVTTAVTTATPVTITATDGTVTLTAVLTVVCSSAPTAPPSSFPAGETIFIDDLLPAGAAMSGALRWDLSQKASGEFSLAAPYAGSGLYQTSISGLAESLGANEKLFAYVRVADCAVPRQIVLRARVGGQWVSASWGEPVVILGSITMGAVPAAGSWQRLDLLLRDLGEGEGDPVITDLELLHVDGQVWFDRIGRTADCVAARAEQPSAPTDEDVLLDDDAPSGVTFESVSNGPLQWSTAQAASGSLSLVNPYRGAATNVTGIANLAQPLVAGSKLSLYALVDSCSPPVRQIHLRITTTAGSGTVSWGDPVWDVDSSTLDGGPVPSSGTWTRLEVPFDALGLDSGTLTRIDVAHVDGRVWFDRIALWPVAGARLTSFVSDHESTVSVGTTVTWTATATGTVHPLEYRFERRDDLGNWSIVQPYGMQPSYTWTTTAADVGTNAVRVSVRNGGSTADFEDTATLLVRVVDGGEEGLWLHDAQERFAWWKRWFEPRVPVSLAVHHGAIATTSDLPARRHSLYTPELQLLAETEITTAPSPPIAYEYVWFAGQPLAQIGTATGAIHWYFNDHLGTPILQTDADAGVAWRVEYEPYGSVFASRTGADKHQPLQFPGQESEFGRELSYNMFRWYRSSWGRYTQGDPLGLHLYTYVSGNPLNWVDPFGLIKIHWKYQQTNTGAFAFKNGCTKMQVHLSHGCKLIGCQYPSKKPAWKLEFQLDGLFTIIISAALTDENAAKTLQHEMEHVAEAQNAVLNALSYLLPYEKPYYDSEGQCEAAASKAYNALKVNVPSGAGVDNPLAYIAGKILPMGSCQ